MALVASLATGAIACDTPKVKGPNSARTDGGGATSGTGARGGSGSAAGGSGGFGLPDGGSGAGGAAGSAPGPGPSGGDRCAEQSHEAEMVPLDLLLLVDTSGSMDQEVGGRSKWSMVNEALLAFLRDPMSAGLGVGVSFFPAEEPAKVCTSDAQCGGLGNIGSLCGARACVSAGGSARGALPCIGGFCLPGTSCVPVGRCTVSGGECAMGGRACPGGPADSCDTSMRTCRLTEGGGCQASLYTTPQVPIAILPGAEPTVRMAIEAVSPAGQTPMQPAVEGALGHLRTRLQAQPGRRAALVLATDGLPEGCGMQQVSAIVASVAAARGAAIPTYVIGVFTGEMLPTSQPTLTELATAGGTGMPFVLEPNQSLTQRFLEALSQIRGAALACEFQIPRPASGMQDFGKVNVRFTGAGVSEDLVYVRSIDRCDPVKGGWYYDVDPATGTPGRILVCPTSCQRFKAQAGGKVEIRIGCTTRVE